MNYTLLSIGIILGLILVGSSLVGMPPVQVVVPPTGAENSTVGRESDLGSNVFR